jgi:hypothetical protein
MSSPATTAHEKQVTVIVNGRDKVVPKEDLSYWDVVKLAFPDATPNDTTYYTITFKRGQGNKPEGTLVAGETLKVKEGMIINVSPTTRS